MKLFWSFLIIACLLLGGFFYFSRPGSQKKLITPLGQMTIKPLEKYSLENLKKTKFGGGQISLGEKLKEEENFVSYVFFVKVNGKKVSGLINLPTANGTFPVIVMARGYVDREMYTTGEGTRHGGEVLAANGFITLAPDFLGYGQSDMPPKDVFEDRFLTYVTELELLASLDSLNSTLESKGIVGQRIDQNKIGLWGHSNGGQITLTVLEVSGKNYPTVLWAPVSKPFPYSILYYTDDIEDHGKALRKVLAEFEQDYDAEKYSLTNYYAWIKAPIQIHQGGMDSAVPQIWSDDLSKTLQESDLKVDYFVYPQEDHNFSQGSWGTVMERTVAFYKESFK